jgi:hypothetical protein
MCVCVCVSMSFMSLTVRMKQCRAVTNFSFRNFLNLWTNICQEIKILIVFITVIIMYDKTVSLFGRRYTKFFTINCYKCSLKLTYIWELCKKFELVLRRMQAYSSDMDVPFTNFTAVRIKAMFSEGRRKPGKLQWRIQKEGKQ